MKNCRRTISRYPKTRYRTSWSSHGNHGGRMWKMMTNLKLIRTMFANWHRLDILAPMSVNKLSMISKAIASKDYIHGVSASNEIECI